MMKIFWFVPSVHTPEKCYTFKKTVLTSESVKGTLVIEHESDVIYIINYTYTWYMWHKQAFHRFSPEFFILVSFNNTFKHHNCIGSNNGIIKVRIANLWASIWTQELQNMQQECQPLNCNIWFHKYEICHKFLYIRCS